MCHIRIVRPSGQVHPCAEWRLAGYQTRDRTSRIRCRSTYSGRYVLLIYGGLIRKGTANFWIV